MINSNNLLKFTKSTHTVFSTLITNGYQTQVFEFVSLEHTSKNKMILAIKKQVSLQQKQEVLEQIAAIKRFYGIKEHCLETLLVGQTLA
jgi:hypothetical protein